MRQVWNFSILETKNAWQHFFIDDFLLYWWSSFPWPFVRLEWNDKQMNENKYLMKIFILILLRYEIRVQLEI